MILRTSLAATLLLGLTVAGSAGDTASATASEVASPTAVERYAIDRSHTWIGFSARHMLVTRVRGRFNDFEGEILYDPEDVANSQVNVTIQVQSVDTDNQRRDDHLRSSDFFEAETWPAITFQGTGVERDGEQLVLVGDLTIKDVTRSVRIPFELMGPVETGQGQKRMGAEGELTVNRFDYGLQWDRTIETGGLVVSEEVTLELSVEAVHRTEG